MKRIHEIIINASLLTCFAWIGWVILAFLHFKSVELIQTLQVIAIEAMFTFFILCVLCWRVPEVTFFSKCGKICSIPE